MASVSMEFPSFTNFRSLSRPSFCPPSRIAYFSRSCNFHRAKSLSLGNSKHIAKGSAREQSLLSCEKAEFVEVIGIGSRSDAILNFCLDRPLQSRSSLRFWHMTVKESPEVQLQEIFLRKDLYPSGVDVSKFAESRSRTIILVVCGGYGSECSSAVDILRVARSANGFVIAIVLRPFSFEGRRRQDEVKDLAEKLKVHASLCIDVDMDKLLDKDLVTLDEALKMGNNAVLLAINAISVLICEKNRRFLDVLHKNVTEVNVTEITKILEGYNEATIGYGAGYDIKTSVLHALCDCPFLGTGVKDLNGIVLCILASSDSISDSDIHSLLHFFRQTTEFRREIIVSTVHEPELEHGLFVTTVITVGSSGQQDLQNHGILYRLVQSIPFVSNLFNKDHRQSDNTEISNALGNASSSKSIKTSGSGDMEEVFQDGEPQSISVESFSLRKSSNEYEKNGDELPDASFELSNFHNQIYEGIPTLHRKELISHFTGPGYQIAKQWVQRRAGDSRNSSMSENLSIFCLPIGVKSPGELTEMVDVTSAKQQCQPEVSDDLNEQPLKMTPFGALTDAGFEVAKGLYSSASTILKGKDADVIEKQGLLSARAASMLEAERDSEKIRNPVVQIEYRGGIYRGRCQGGLPEGKGRLVSKDGSIYDGMWRYGKRSGIGIYYFSNGDVFQGSWRDDVMHGKGWFYFHTGDRWFVNFWKGKANGEGRFYSKSGDVFFGQFQDGWRHGHFLCIDVNGERSIEIWEEGVLLSRRHLDADFDDV